MGMITSKADRSNECDGEASQPEVLQVSESEGECLPDPSFFLCLTPQDTPSDPVTEENVTFFCSIP